MSDNIMRIGAKQGAPEGAFSLGLGEELHVAPGKMQATKHISMITELVTGLMESIKRFFFGGPSFFNNRFKAEKEGAWILLEEKIPGQLAAVQIGEGESIKIRRDRLVASSTNLNLDTTYEGVSGFMKGTGVAMLNASLKADQLKGKLIFHADKGTVKQIDINPEDGPVTIDNDSILGYTSGVTSNVRVSGNGVKSIVFGGEGLVYDFRGKGTVYVASTPQDTKKPHTTHVHINSFNEQQSGSTVRR
jgi:uncharacterized protein (AIM24 family)